MRTRQTRLLAWFITHVKLVTLATLLIAGLMPSQAGAQQPTDLGPAPTSGFGGATGRVSALVCSRTDANLYYAAGADGGVWKTTDGGNSWQPLTDDRETTAIGALALDPVNEQVVYAGSGEANFANHSRYGLGLYKSVDGGATWSTLAGPTFAGRCFSRIVIDPLNTSVLYAAITHAGGFPALAAAKGHPLADGPVGVYKSMDGGVSWSLLSGGLPALDATDLAIDPANPANVYVAIGHIFGSASNGIYKSSDAGLTWSRLSAGLPQSNIGRIGIAISASDPQRLYANFAGAADATGGDSGFMGSYRSNNGGASWTHLAFNVNVSTYGWYFGCIGVNPVNADTVFMGGINAVLSTSGGGGSVALNGAHPDFHAVAWDAAGRLVCGNDGGVYRLSGTNSLIARNAGLGVTQFYAGLSTHPSNPDIVLGGLQDNGTVRRNTASLTWPMVLGGDGGWTQIDPANPLRMFGESQGTGALSRSTDGGASWLGIGSGLSGRNCFLPPYLVDPTTPGRMIYGTERVWQSLNYGDTWTPLSADVTGGGAAAIRSLAMAPSNPQVVYAATNDGRVLVSTNGGGLFNLIRTGNAGWPRVTRELTVDATDPATLYLSGAAFGAPHVLRTVDMGGNWQSLDAGLPDVPVNVVAADVRSRPVTLYAGTDAGLFTTSSGSGLWREVAGVPHTAVIDLILEPARSRVILGTQGRGAWLVEAPPYCSADFDNDGDTGTDADIAAFFACLGGRCCEGCGNGDFNNDGDAGTDADIEAFFRVLAGGAC